MGIVTPQIEAVLKSLHDAPGRHYHVWRHPLSMRALAARYAHLITDMESVLAMIAFHDAVYDSQRNDNEERSADLAREMLSSVSLPPAQLEFILSGILATKRHLIPSGLSVSQGRDVAFLLDADLAILGASEEEFDAFDAAVRKEYAWVTFEDWKVGRAAVMRSFSERPAIYLTDEFLAAFEDQARRNIARLLKALEG
jgi:predicted metal-dependent HD superfamily phosphohydrolase